MRIFSSLGRCMVGLAAAVTLVTGLANIESANAAGILSVVPPVGVPKLNIPGAYGKPVHIMPTSQMAAQMRAARTAAPPPVLNYHGGRIMTPVVSIYTIYWKPAGTTMAANYQFVLNRMMLNYGGHAIANINTQYYQTVGAVTTYSSGIGYYSGIYSDTAPYPASGCSTYAVPGVTPIACLTDAQLQAEITRVMAISAVGKPVWTPGFNKIYLIYTAQGVESCSGSGCAYTAYCAYHSYLGSPSNPTIYANEPYGEPSFCAGASGFPNGGGGFADSAATAARHEISEASTDPTFLGWYDSGTGQENSDQCAYQYGTNTWDAGLANYMWGGTFLELQMEYSQHASGGAGGCVQQGP